MANLFFRELELEQHSNKFRPGFFWISKKNRRAETVSAFFFLMRYQSRFVSIMDSSTRERKVIFSAILKQRDDGWHGSVRSFCFSSRVPKTLRDAKLILKDSFP